MLPPGNGMVRRAGFQACNHPWRAYALPYVWSNINLAMLRDQAFYQ